FEFADRAACLLITVKLELHAVGIVLATCEAMVLSRLGMRWNVMSFCGLVFGHGGSAILTPQLLFAGSSLLPGRQLCNSTLPNGFVVMQNPQRGKGLQKFIRFEQMHWMAGAAGEALLFKRICFVNQKSTGFESSDKSREELALEIEEDQHQIILFLTQ